jgi:chlorophyllase
MATAQLYFLVLALASTVVFGRNISPAEEDLGRLIDPFVPGDYPINHTAYRQALSLFLDTNIDVYAPNATGNFPVFYFTTGFGGSIQFNSIKNTLLILKDLNHLIFKSGIVPAEAHTQLFSQIASHGVVLVAVWKIGSPENSFDPAWLQATVEFVENRLENSLHNQEGKSARLLLLD